jgi:predicted HicB family RNase H-like nuclease
MAAGRPPQSKHGTRRQITLKLHPKIHAALFELAEAEGVTLTAVVEAGILARWKKKHGEKLKTD